MPIPMAAENNLFTCISTDWLIICTLLKMKSCVTVYMWCVFYASEISVVQGRIFRKFVWTKNWPKPYEETESARNRGHIKTHHA